MDEPLRPMEPVRWSDVFDDPSWQYEVKWDGVRCLAYVDGLGVRCYGRSGADWTGRFPDIEGEIGRVPGVYDGELVVLLDGRPSFPAMMRRLRGRGGAAHYLVFDRLRDEDGTDLRAMALHERQSRIDWIQDLSTVHRVEGSIGNGRAVFSVAQSSGLEGVVAKRWDAPYVSGKSPLWRKIKCWRTLTCLVTGGSMSGGELRSVKLGLDDGGGLQSIGSVGGLSRAEGEALLEALSGTEPVLCEVAYLEWTPLMKLRHPKWLGISKGRR